MAFKKNKPESIYYSPLIHHLLYVKTYLAVRKHCSIVAFKASKKKNTQLFDTKTLNQQCAYYVNWIVTSSIKIG